MLPNSLCGICQWFGRWQLLRKRKNKSPSIGFSGGQLPST
jgi:hypothetical protein